MPTAESEKIGLEWKTELGLKKGGPAVGCGLEQGGLGNYWVSTACSGPCVWGGVRVCGSVYRADLAGLGKGQATRQAQTSLSGRSEERPAGKEVLRLFRSRWSL